jgi:hypothetical protein
MQSSAFAISTVRGVALNKVRRENGDGRGAAFRANGMSGKNEFWTVVVARSLSIESVWAESNQGEPERMRIYAGPRIGVVDALAAQRDPREALLVRAVHSLARRTSQTGCALTCAANGNLSSEAPKLPLIWRG